MPARYRNDSRRTPFWLILLTLALVGFGIYYLVRGAMNFIADKGDIAAPLAQDTSDALAAQPSTPFSTLDLALSLRTNTPSQNCQQFRITVVKARIRECPKDTCNTIQILNQYTIICIYGTVLDSSEWYVVNLSPDDPIPQIGYVHESVVKAVHPTPRPSSTPRATPSPTPIPFTITPS